MQTVQCILISLVSTSRSRVDTISEVSGKRRQTTMVTYGNDSSRGEDTCCTNNEQSPIKWITQEYRTQLGFLFLK